MTFVVIGALRVSFDKFLSALFKTADPDQLAS